MKIVFFEITKEEQTIFKDLSPDLVIEFYEEKLTLENINLATDADIISVFINSEISKEIIDLLPNLKYLTTRSTGFDHIDVECSKSKNIKISNVPSYGSRTVAEFAFALILDLSRKVSSANKHIREEANFSIAGFQGFDLFGKTLGVIGTGKIGKNVIKIAKGFGMEIVAFDLFPDQKFAEENSFKYLTLNEVLKNSDIVTLHTPYSKDTYHLINKNNIKFFKKGAYIINTARGEILDTEALILD